MEFSHCYNAYFHWCATAHQYALDMSRFPSAAHLCSWAGVCPGNHQSAGKRYHGKTRKGNKTLKSMLVQCAKVASRVRGSYFAAQYQCITAKRGKNRATMAVAHSMLIAIYLVLKETVHSVIWERIIMTASAENIKFEAT